MKEVKKKTEKEKQTITYMISYFCHKKHHTEQLCNDCQILLNYAIKRIECCPFKETKTFCSACKVHCYQKGMREQIRSVMRFSGPRMITHHPWMTLHHLYIEKKEKHSC